MAVCAAQSPAAEEAVQKGAEATVQKGKKILLDYTLTVDGQVIDSSLGKVPLEFTQGDGKLIPGLTRQLEGMRAGDSKTIVVSPDEAYGPINPAASQEVPLSALPADPKPQVGTTLQARDPSGRVIMMRIAQIKKDVAVMDLNHPLAGKTLTFQVKIVSLQ
jgi:FKBP-type peptidyl-prolyl cis-trans isomerase 2